ncbi:TPA: amidohydrolase [Legionella pneumophila]|nr:amidohydrolase [Legionella pneumophila]
MGFIDVHAHYVSKNLLVEARQYGHAFGVSVHSSPDGDVLEFQHNRERVRPVFAELCDLESRAEYMNGEGVSRQVISPWTDMIPAGMPVQQARQWIRLQNDTLIADAHALGDFFSAMGTLPLQDPDAAIDELKYLTDVCGVYAVELVTSVGGEDLDAPFYRPLWKEIADRGVFVLLHPPRCPFDGARPKSYFLNNLVFFPVDTTVAAAKLIFSGILKDFPNLKICLPHGGGFLPYQIGRLDHGFEVHSACQGQIDVAPSEYLRSFYYDTITHDDVALRYLIDRVGADRVLYGSDFPFEMTDDVGTRRLSSVPGLSPEQFAQISHGNAQSALKQPVPTL